MLNHANLRHDLDRGIDMNSSDYTEIGGLRIKPAGNISADYIKSPEDAKKICKYIEGQLAKYKLDNLLVKIHDDLLQDRFPDYPKFVFASLIKFVVLNSNIYGEFSFISEEEFKELLRMITEYELYDPNFRKNLKSDPKRTTVTYILKGAGQLQWDRNIKYMISRTLYIYEELIKDVDAPQFIKDIANFKFEEKFGFSLHDFIKIGAIIWAGSINHRGGMRRDYIDNARSRGMPVPNNEIVKACLKQLAIDPGEFRKDTLLKRYNLNPLLRYPLIRLRAESETELPFDDKFIAPFSNMIIYRITIGLYYQLYNEYGINFATYFGDLFELYVSNIINNLNISGRIVSEKEIDLFLPIKGGKGGMPKKRPDWVVFTDNGVIFIECKATHYTQDTFERGIDARNTAWLSQIRKSLDQFEKFELQLPQLCKRIGVDYSAKKEIQRIIVSFEPLLGLKKGHLKEYIDGERERDWVLISVEELEEIQPYIAKGYDLWSFISEFKSTSYHDFFKIIEKMKAKTGASDHENMFYEYRLKIFNELLNDAEGI